MHHTERERPFICLFAIGICCVLSPCSLFLSPALLHRVPSLLPVLDLLWNPYMVISFSNAFGTGNNFQQQPKKMGKRRMERTPAGQLLIDTHKQAKKMPCNALHWASLRTYTPFAISALNLIYIHFIIFAFSATPTRAFPAQAYPVLPLSYPACIPSQWSLAIAPGCFFCYSCSVWR